MQIKAIQNHQKAQLNKTFNPAIPSKSNKDEIFFSSKVSKCKLTGYLSDLFQAFKDMRSISKFKKALKNHEFRQSEFSLEQIQKRNEQTANILAANLEKKKRTDDLKLKKAINSSILKSFTVKGNIDKKNYTELIYNTAKLYDYFACQKPSIEHYSMEEKLVDRLKDAITKVKSKDFDFAQRILDISPDYVSTRPLAELQSVIIEEIGKRGTQKQLKELVLPVLSHTHVEKAPSPILTVIRVLSDKNNPEFTEKLAFKLNEMANTKIDFNKYINIPIVNGLIKALEKSKNPEYIEILKKFIKTQENSGSSGVLHSAGEAIRELKKYRETLSKN